ncbi:MAG TPA: 4-hydroxy-3-methylbut-2-enyl diphosphate reductase [Gemmatimonadaceae bacterium]|nr:4-hydroxy-3-methylbut-2-enyl diphosphate reductase [Gemmatimonadaceae bacterium]
MSSAPDTYFRKGFGLKAEVQDALAADYTGRIVDFLRANDNTLTVGDVTIRLAREFGFCYGVERAVEYAYQTRHKFPSPDQRVILLGEIIHNPHVNARMREIGITILGPRPEAPPDEPRFDYSTITPSDVVLLPAFGVTLADFNALREIGCIVVDTTCGSVLHVWKRVDSYARDGLTVLVHGKYYHEETRATASQVSRYPGRHYVIVRDMGEADAVCRYIEALGQGRITLQETEAFVARFAKAISPGFDPPRDLRRIGVANQTTMLARESLAIGEAVGAAMARGFGEEYRSANFRTFDTICSATQERQDAVRELLDEPLNAMIVLGGYNSSNTISLAALCAERVTTFHVESPEAIDPERRTIAYRVAGVHHEEALATDWLPKNGPVRIGLTAGASTPNNTIGEVVTRILATRNLKFEADS